MSSIRQEANVSSAYLSQATKIQKASLRGVDDACYLGGKRSWAS